MKLIKLHPLLMLLVAVLPSCSNDDEVKGNIQNVAIPSSLNVVSSYDKVNGTREALQGADYGVIVNLDNGTLQLVVTNMVYAKDERAISFTLPEFKLSIGSNGWKMDHTDPVSVETAWGKATVSDIHVTFAMRLNGSQNLVGISMVLDDRYELNTIFTTTQYTAKTTSTDITDPTNNPFTTEMSAYLVEIDPKTMKARLQIASPKFLTGMPDNLGIMIFNDIPFTFTDNGFSFSKQTLIPNIGNDPYPAFEITNLSGKVVAGQTLTLTFDCAKYNRNVSVAGNIY